MSAWGLQDRPKLASRVRLRFDRHENRYMLLYPERGMLLNPSAAEIAKLCTGMLTVTEMIAHLHLAAPSATRTELERDVFGFLGELEARGLVQFESADPPR